MKIRRRFRHTIFYVISIAMLLTACHSGNSQLGKSNENDSTVNAKSDTVTNKAKGSSDSTAGNGQVAGKTNEAKTEVSTVLIYNFHVTNRCASCIAIEEATTKTLNTYFANEVKQGRIKRQILNVDDDFNRKISEKYQAFGSGLFVTRVFKGNETTSDLTGDGFKFAKNKEERFIEILKNKITEYLK